MMRRTAFATIALTIILSLGSAGSYDGSLRSLISENEDPLMSTIDLAFFLATHGFDATPMDGYVQVKDNGTLLKLVPNKGMPGLADVEVLGTA
jgi:hypothetical protein